MKHIAQIGSFDVENYGDLLFPYILKSHLGNNYTIDLFSPTGGNWCFFDQKVYPIKEFEKKCLEEKYDAIIIGGGDVIRTDKKIFITSDFYELSQVPSLQLWLYPILIANKLDIPVFFNSVGVPNDFSYDEIPVLKIIFDNFKNVVVRDDEAGNALKNIGITNVMTIPDSVISISNILLPKELNVIFEQLVDNNFIPKLSDYIVFQHNSRFINDQVYYKKIIECIKHISKKYKVLLMPIGYIHDDDKVLKKIYDEKIDNVFIVNYKHKLNPIEMTAILANSNGYIGTSMHGAIVSYSYKKPILILNMMKSKKLYGFSKLSNNYDCLIDNIDNFIYVFDNRFGKIDVENLKDNIKIINDNFKILKKNIEIKKNNISKFDILNFIHESIKERDIIGYMCKDMNKLLDRKVFIWKNVNGVYETETEATDVYLTISNHKNTLIFGYNFNIIDFGETLNIDGNLFVPKGSYIHIKSKSKKLKCNIDYDIEDKIINLIKNNNINMVNNIVDEYKSLENKYLDLLIKK